MNKTTQFILTGILLVLIVLVGLVGLAMNRGALTFSAGKPQFNAALFLHPKPLLDRQIQFPETFPQEARDPFNARLEETKEKIRADETNVLAWFDLAILYKMVADYNGAVEIWNYVSAKYPSDSISIHNLAEHYFHQEKNYKKAEKLYHKAIGINPSFTTNYSDLHEMYRYVYKQNTGAAVDILLEGIQNVSGLGKVDLTIALASYYRDTDDSQNARIYFSQARDIARQLGNNQLVEAMDAELARLSQ